MCSREVHCRRQKRNRHGLDHLERLDLVREILTRLKNIKLFAKFSLRRLQTHLRDHDWRLEDQN